MPTIQQLLDTINTTYRNSYSVTQKVEWMNETQKQIFQLVRHETIPYTFYTVADFAFYPLPGDCDPFGIKNVTIETNVGSDRFIELKFISIESGEELNSTDSFYSIASNQNIFINPLPNSDTAGKKIYMYYNKRPSILSSSSLSVVPDLEEDFHELLILGCLERIARARGEYDDKNVFANDFQVLLRAYQKQYKQPYPEYSPPKDMLPRRRGHVFLGNRGRRVYPDGFISD